MKTSGLLLTLALAGPVLALPENSPVPGGVAVVDLGPASSPAPQVRWGEKRVAVVADRGHWFALLGIPLDTLPGELEIAVSSGSTATATRSVKVGGKRYPEQRLTIKDKRKVEPGADELARIAREQEVIDAAKNRFSETLPATDFALPANGPLSSRFGLKRFFNGLPRNPHSGLDVAVGTGTPVKAPADGVVAEAGDFFFGGNTVFVDHGQGLITAYGHLSRIDVRPGQQLKRGELIGAVGATGRVTGPHLHWTVLLNGTAVDPERFLEWR